MPVIVRKPAMNLRTELTKAQAKQPCAEEEFYFTGDALDTDFWLPIGWIPKRVYQDEAKKRKGDQEAWVQISDGYRYGVRFAVVPADQSKIDVEGVLK